MTKKIAEPQPIVKSQRNGRITVITNWQYAQEVPPIFKHLMALLLENKRGARSDEQRDSRKSRR